MYDFGESHAQDCHDETLRTFIFMSGSEKHGN